MPEGGKMLDLPQRPSPNKSTSCKKAPRGVGISFVSERHTLFVLPQNYRYMQLLVLGTLKWQLKVEQSGKKKERGKKKKKGGKNFCYV